MGSFFSFSSLWAFPWVNGESRSPANYRKDIFIFWPYRGEKIVFMFYDSIRSDQGKVSFVLK